MNKERATVSLSGRTAQGLTPGHQGLFSIESHLPWQLAGAGLPGTWGFGPSWESPGQSGAGGPALPQPPLCALTPPLPASLLLPGPALALDIGQHTVHVLGGGVCVSVFLHGVKLPQSRGSACCARVRTLSPQGPRETWHVGPVSLGCAQGARSQAVATRAKQRQLWVCPSSRPPRVRALVSRHGPSGSS